MTSMLTSGGDPAAAGTGLQRLGGQGGGGRGGIPAGGQHACHDSSSWDEVSSSFHSRSQVSP